MRFVAVCLTVVVASLSAAALPTRKPEAEAVVERVAPATAVEKEAGVVVTVFLVGRTGGVAVSKDTPIHRQMGKLVPVAEPGDISAGQKVSVWVDERTGKADGVLIFP